MSNPDKPSLPDAPYSAERPASGPHSGGRRRIVSVLAAAAVAAGVIGIAASGVVGSSDDATVATDGATTTSTSRSAGDLVTVLRQSTTVPPTTAPPTTVEPTTTVPPTTVPPTTVPPTTAPPATVPPTTTPPTTAPPAPDPATDFAAWYNSLDAQGRANWERLLNPPPPPPPPPAPPAPAISNGSVWDALAQCESGGNWSINTGNGFYGGIQFMHSTWVNMGGRKWAEYPHQATREQQIEVATRLQAQYGWGQWPACSARLGLR